MDDIVWSEVEVWQENFQEWIQEFCNGGIVIVTCV